MQQPAAAAQTVLSPEDVSTGISLIFFAQYFGGALWISAANNVFANCLARNVASIAGVDAGDVVKVGATALREVVGDEQLALILPGYNSAVIDAFYVGVACACATGIGALTMEWKSMRT